MRKQGQAEIRQVMKCNYLALAVQGTYGYVRYSRCSKVWLARLKLNVIDTCNAVETASDTPKKPQTCHHGIAEGAPQTHLSIVGPPVQRPGSRGSPAYQSCQDYGNGGDQDTSIQGQFRGVLTVTA